MRAILRDGCIVMQGRLDKWADVIDACSLAATKYSTTHVVNDIVCEEAQDKPIRLPALADDALEGRQPDVLVVGGGISGVSIARELMRWKLDVLLVEKEADLALQASGRNDGEPKLGAAICAFAKSCLTLRLRTTAEKQRHEDIRHSKELSAAQ